MPANPFTSLRLPRPSWSIVTALLITACGALLRLDAFTAKYGALDHPGWARVATGRVAPLGQRLRPSAVVWGREAHPYVGGDPYSYLKYAREMTSFYQPHVREPVFLALTRFGLWAVDGQDVGVSVASMIGSVAAIFATFLLGAAASSSIVGLVAAAVMAIEMEAVTWAVDGWRDDTFTAMFLFAAWALVRLLQRPSFANAVLAGLVCGLTCLTRITALSFVLPALAWIALADRADRRERALHAATAFGLTAVVVAPFLLSCAIATGDPFFAINSHTTYYRVSEGLPVDLRVTAGDYLRQKFAQHPIGMFDTGVTGLIVRPFLIKWNGLDAWMPWLGTIFWWSSLAGMAMWPFTPRGRFLILLLLSSLVPYAFTWNIGGGGQWRFTMHVYALYVIAAGQAWTVLLSPWWKPAIRPRRWRVAAVAATASAGCVAYLALPWYVAREAIANKEAVNIEAGPRDWIFYRRGWSAWRQDGVVTTHVSRERQATVHFPLPASKPYEIVLRFDPVAPGTQQGVTILFNRQLLGTLRPSWNPERMGSYRVPLPVAWVRAGGNEITLVPDALVPAGSAGPRYSWIDPAERLGVRVWYLRVLD